MYERPKIVRLLGCLIPLGGALILTTCIFHNFGNMRSDQSADGCERTMLPPILRKTAAFPADKVLRTKHASIEHLLHGNKEDIQPLLRRLKEAEWSVEETAFEVGDGIKVIDDPVLFRRSATRRVREICALAAVSHSEYESWWINASEIADYVAQNAGLGTVTEGHN